MRFFAFLYLAYFARFASQAESLESIENLLQARNNLPRAIPGPSCNERERNQISDRLIPQIINIARWARSGAANSRGDEYAEGSFRQRFGPMSRQLQRQVKRQIRKRFKNLQEVLEPVFILRPPGLSWRRRFVIDCDNVWTPICGDEEIITRGRDGAWQLILVRMRIFYGVFP